VVNAQLAAAEGRDDLIAALEADEQCQRELNGIGQWVTLVDGRLLTPQGDRHE
jgi:hypothetical protein